MAGWIRQSGGLSSRSSRTGTAGATGAWKRQRRDFASQDIPARATYWCEQDVKWQRANAGLIMVYDHTGASHRLVV